MNDLREKLAKQLYRARFPHACDWCGTCLAQWEKVADGWALVADECIRQMEWARTGLIASNGSHGSRFYTNANPPVPLTAAPDDWRPE